MAAPTITSATPQAGSYYGGTSVAIVGTGFNVSLPLVYFGDKLATGVTVTDSTHLTCVSPAAISPSQVDIKIVTSDGSSLAAPIAARFYYFDPLSSPTFQDNNIYFDPDSNYTFFGDVVFVKAPLFASGGGGGSFDPGTSYTFTAPQAFSAGALVQGFFTVQTTGDIRLELAGASTLKLDSSGGTLTLEGPAAITGGTSTAKLPPTGYTYLVVNTSTQEVKTYNGTA